MDASSGAGGRFFAFGSVGFNKTFINGGVGGRFFAFGSVEFGKAFINGGAGVVHRANDDEYGADDVLCSCNKS